MGITNDALHQRYGHQQRSIYQTPYAEQCAYFLRRMKELEDAGGSNLTDRTMTIGGIATNQTRIR